MLDGASLKKSRNRYDWLGEGIYFWEHGPERALDFAREQKRRGKVASPFVLGAYIDLGRCFDLTDVWATSQLGRFYHDLKAALEEAGQPLANNERARPGDSDLLLRKLDCAVINFGLENLKREGGGGYETVRGVFPEGEPAFEGSMVREKTHVQIAVRNPDCILGYFLPAGYNLKPEEDE